MTRSGGYKNGSDRGLTRDTSEIEVKCNIASLNSLAFQTEYLALYENERIINIGQNYTPPHRTL